ncbi:unnamed protein product [Rotaria magnacalcarata]|uniref:Uncharacterized protein n=1 Tax=Rotaria magnacalcarata TaxID=392030 RepID=A0A819ZI76_9BILA|nr:unnamed protein product [Rotaria magnacalcarata]CAF2240815.1 unnamed protein product [Rotaria magnacalcarata]CAF4163867.1 unnamed protein product [Rotaria magnacalcarata]CAF4281396.1 unnamed protein product [Rotaria magnacalcarata]
MTTIPEDKFTQKVFHSIAEAFLQGVMTFPKNEKIENEYSYQYFTEPSSSSSSNSVSSGNKQQATLSTTKTEEGTPNSPSSQKDQEY